MKEEKCLWESRELGCDEKYVAVATKEEMEDFDKHLGLVEVKLKISQNLYKRLKDVSDLRGLNIKAVMREYLENSLK